MNAWISPTGRVFDVGESYHANVAADLGFSGCTGALNRGWVRVSAPETRRAWMGIEFERTVRRNVADRLLQVVRDSLANGRGVIVERKYDHARWESYPGQRAAWTDLRRLLQGV